MIHVLQSSRNLDRIKELWKTQGLPFGLRQNDGMVTHVQRVYFSSATYRINASMTMMSMALDRLGEKNTVRRETLLSLQADSQNA